MAEKALCDHCSISAVGHWKRHRNNIAKDCLTLGNMKTDLAWKSRQAGVAAQASLEEASNAAQHSRAQCKQWALAALSGTAKTANMCGKLLQCRTLVRTLCLIT